MFKQKFLYVSKVNNILKDIWKRCSEHHQLSEMRAQKWHLLDHLADIIYEKGKMDFLYTGLRGRTHELFKTCYRIFLVTNFFCNNRSTGNYYQSLNRSHFPECDDFTFKRQNLSKMFAMTYDRDTMLRSGLKTSIGKLENFW